MARNLTIEQLTKDQFSILRLLANGKVKIYCNLAEADNLGFNGILRLVELGLLVDISSKHPDTVIEYRLKTKADVAIVQISPIGQLMFEKHRWTKWRN